MALEICGGDFRGPYFKEAGDSIVGYIYVVDGDGGSYHGRYSRGWTGLPGVFEGVKEKLGVGVAGFIKLDF